MLFEAACQKEHVSFDNEWIYALKDPLWDDLFFITTTEYKFSPSVTYYLPCRLSL